MLALDFAMDPNGNVWLLETNTAPLWGLYPTDDKLTPAVYRTALELALTAHADANDALPSRHGDWFKVNVDSSPRVTSNGHVRSDYNACASIPRRDARDPGPPVRARARRQPVQQDEPAPREEKAGRPTASRLAGQRKAARATRVAIHRGHVRLR